MPPVVPINNIPQEEIIDTPSQTTALNVIDLFCGCGGMSKGLTDAGLNVIAGIDVWDKAVLPIRGKILNVEKARIDRVLQNNEVQALITALGTGIHDDFDLAKLRYHTIILIFVIFQYYD